MGRKCFLPNCNSGYTSCVNKYSLFQSPKCEILGAKWREVLRLHRSDRCFTSNDSVCEKHFRTADVIRNHDILGKDGIVIQTAVLKRVKLIPNAIPSVFEGCPSISSNNRKRLPAPEAAKQLRTENVEIIELCPSTTNNFPTSTVLVDEFDTCIVNANSPCQQNLFEILWTNPGIISLPNISWSYHKTELGEQQMIVFSEVRISKNGLPEYYKQVVLKTGTLQPKIVIIDEEIELRKFGIDVLIQNTPDQAAIIDDLIKKVESQTVCCGGPSDKAFPTISLQSASKKMGVWRHNLCTILLGDRSSIRQCPLCVGLEKTLINKWSRQMIGKKPQFLFCSVNMNETTKNGVTKLRKAVRLQRRAMQRLQQRQDEKINKEKE